MILAAAIAWESVALVTALTGGGAVGIVKIVKAVRNGGVTEDRVKTLVHEETVPLCEDISEIKVDVGVVKARTEDILTLLKDGR